MDFGASDAIGIVKSLGKVTWEKAYYFMNLNFLFEELVEEKAKLEANIEDTKNTVEESRAKNIKVGKLLELDLKKAEDLIKDVDDLQELVEVKKSYCFGHCPNLIWQYHLGKRVANKTEAMKQLNAQFPPQKLSASLSLPGMEYYSSEGFTFFDSTKKAYDELLKLLEDPHIRRIGLYGVGGCGKTTLAKEVGKEAQRLFARVVFVVVSSTIDVRRIQGNIANQLNLVLEENETDRAKSLSQLRGSEKILIILDDVWEELNFEDIGIPCDDNQEGCKILLTTRNRGICVSLNCEMVHLDLLPEKEASQLFKKLAGIKEGESSESSKELPQFNNKASKRLPIAITTIGRALKDKTLESKEASDLQKYYEEMVFSNNFQAPYERTIRFSYDHLKDAEAQELFLLCSLFPEDSEINEEDLIRMEAGLGLFANIYSCKSARIRGRAIIRKLVDSSLLLQVNEGSVTLHDMIREVALKISGKQIQTIMEHTVPPSLIELSKHVAIEEIKMLYCHNINEFPLQFKCPNLEILIVYKEGKGAPAIPDEFVIEMRELKVLTIIDKSYWENSTLILPKSIWSLQCLRNLCIRGCRLEFSFPLRHLQHLEILEFSNCSIMQLPNDIAELKLKLLDVSRCRVRGNPYKVLGNCLTLEELYFSEIDLDEEELKDQNLADFFSKSDNLSKLERYDLQIGACVEKLKDDMKSGFLSISPYSDQDTSTSTRAIKALAQRAKVLFLENIPRSYENVIPDIVYQEEDCMKDLIDLLLCNSKGIKCLIDTTNQFNHIGRVFPKLRKLRITRMSSLEVFCHGNPPCDLFKQLKELECSQLPVLSYIGKLELSNLVILKLDGCPKLEYLFTPAVAVSLVLLEELKITKCHGLMYIIGDDMEEDITDNNDQNTYASVFTNLKALVVEDCKMLKYLIPLSFARGLGKLEVLIVYLAPSLKYAFETHQRCSQSDVNLPNLKKLHLLSLEKIISIFPENNNAKFPNVLKSHIENCPNMATTISPDVPKVDSEIEVQVHQEDDSKIEVQVQHEVDSGIEVHVPQGGEPPKKAKLFSGSSIVAKYIKERVDAPIRHVHYSSSFNKYVEDLRIEKEILMFTTVCLMDCMDRKSIEINRNVATWLVKANNLLNEAGKLEQKALANPSGRFKPFPSWIHRYRIGKHAERKKYALTEHRKTCEFQRNSGLALVAHIEDYFLKDFIFFGSRQSIYDSLLMSLKEDEISMIGLFGKKGTGKTTLAKKVAKEAEQHFVKVVFVVVSVNPDVRKIQEKIAGSLDCRLKEEESERERAKQLSKRFDRGERILIILDDVLKKQNLGRIGIPFGVNHKGCNVLITTRLPQVCITMGCQRTSGLEHLEDRESWTLFRKHADISEATEDSLKVEAEKVTQECGGLPISIAVMASSLKGKTDVEYKEALKALQRPVDIKAELGDIQKCFQFCYDNLADENAKSLFLLCSVFPEDYEIHEEYLLRYGIVLGLFGEVNSYEIARNHVCIAKEKLIDSCLLLKVDEGRCVKMHDLFHDLAMSMANKEETVAQEGVQEGQKKNITTLRSLWCENVDKFPEESDFSNLEFLYVGVSGSSFQLEECFKGVSHLRVLVLHRKSYLKYKSNLSLTKSIASLSNLVGLFLEGWELGDISFVVSLKRLEALVLWSCSFKELPNEITDLRKLQLLDLSECVIKINPYKVIGRCSQLQELYFIGNSGPKWKSRYKYVVNFILGDETTLKLERYRIEIGGTSGVFHKRNFSTSRGLSLGYFDPSTSNATVKNLVQRAEVLSLEQISGGCENIIPAMVQQIGKGMNELTELQICDSHEIKCITDSTSHVGAFFPYLSKLTIQTLKHMEALFRAGLFKKLKELELYDCPSLKYPFTLAVAQSLETLEIMSIIDCDRLKHIIEATEEIIPTDDDDQKHISAFPNLKLLNVEQCRELECLGGHWSFNFGNLKKMMVQCCPRLKSLFTPSTAQTMTSLEELIITYCSSLKKVFGVPQDKDGGTITLPRLKILRFIELPNLIAVSHGFKLHLISNVVVEGCPEFQRVYDLQNWSQGQNTVGKDVGKLDSESEEEKEGVTPQRKKRRLRVLPEFSAEKEVRERVAETRIVRYRTGSRTRKWKRD